MTSPECMGASKSDNLLIVEAHAAKDLPQVRRSLFRLALVCVGQSSVGCDVLGVDRVDAPSL